MVTMNLCRSFPSNMSKQLFNTRADIPCTDSDRAEWYKAAKVKGKTFAQWAREALNRAAKK